MKFSWRKNFIYEGSISSCPGVSSLGCRQDFRLNQPYSPISQFLSIHHSGKLSGKVQTCIGGNDSECPEVATGVFSGNSSIYVIVS
jgi:hypothetical protein